MSFSCEITGKNNIDLLKKYDINHQLLGIARSSVCEEEYEYYDHDDLNEIRRIFLEYSNICGDSITREQSIELIVKVKGIIQSNIDSLKINHCDHCKCPDIEPKSWNLDAAKRFLSIPLGEVFKAYGGY